MIKVDRNKINIPDVLSKKKSKGRNETARAIIHFRNPINIAYNVSFSFSAYKDKEVRRALTDLFNGKCAYCESRIVAVSTGDIEHFRPKGGFGKDKKNLTKPAYYWLASNWENLLLSCANCNRTNRFEIVNIGFKTVGKLNQFPISNELYRLRSPLDDFNQEETVRLLLNPCKDLPEVHLYFDDTGLALPNKDKNGVVSEIGKHSIDVYALQRKELVEDREALIIKIKAQLKSVEQAIRMQNFFGVGVDNHVDQALVDEIETLKAFLKNREPHLAIARNLIQPFIDGII